MNATPNQTVVGLAHHSLTHELVRRGGVADGDRVLISRGDHANAQGGTNCLRVIRVGDNVY